jgi:DNA-binding CsgD family transcriptional regulator
MTGISQDVLLDLYGGVTDPVRWRKVLDRVCDDLGVCSAVIQRIQSGGDGAFTTNWLVRDSYSEENGALHDEVVADHINPRMHGEGPSRLWQPGTVLRDPDYPSMRGASGRRFQQALRSIGLGEYLGCCTDLPDGDAVAIVLHRGADDSRHFSAPAERYVRQLARHVRQAIGLADVVEAERGRVDTLGAVVDRMRFGVVTCDASGRVTWISQRARALLATRHTLAIRDGCIVCASERDAQLLKHMLAAGRQGGGALKTPRWEIFGAGGGEVLHGMVAPLPREDAGKGGGGDEETRRVALFLNVPGSTPSPESGAIGRLLGLTPAEARLTAGICDGLSVKEYARLQGIAEGTARFQLKQVLAKTGAARQSDLVRQVCTSLAADLAPTPC